MADEALAHALADCLEALRDGECSLATRIAKYPRYRLELEELLRLVDLIPRLPPGLTADPAFVEQTREWLLGGEARTSFLETSGSDPALT